MCDISSLDYMEKELPTIQSYTEYMLSDTTIKDVSFDSDVLMDYVRAFREIILSPK